MKACTKCFEIKEFEFFVHWAGSVDGYLHKCKECHNLNARLTRKNLTKEARKKLNLHKANTRKKYKDFTPEEHKKQKQNAAKWYNKNREKMAKHNIKWRKNNKERIAQNQKKWRNAHKEHIKQYDKKWVKENIDWVNTYARNYRYKNEYGNFDVVAKLVHKLEKELSNVNKTNK